MIEPLGYMEFLNLMANARLVLTDSRSIQEETTILGVPFGMLRAGPSTGSGQAPRRPPGPQAVGRGVHRAGRPFDRAQGRGRRGGSQLPRSGGAGDGETRRQGEREIRNSQFAIRNLKVERISEARKNLWGIEGGKR